MRDLSIALTWHAARVKGVKRYFKSFSKMEGHGGKKRSLRDYFSSQTKKNKANENDGDQGKPHK